MARFIQQCAYPNAEQYPQLAIKNLQASPDLASVLFNPNNLPATNAGFVTMEVLAPPGVTVTNASGSPCTNGIGGQSCTESCNQAQTDLSTAYTNFFNGSVCDQAVTASTTKQDSAPLANCVAAANGNLNPLVGSAGVVTGATPTGGVTSSLLTNAANFGSSYISQVYLNCLVSAGWQMGMNQGVGTNGNISLPDSYCVITSNQQNQYNVENAASANMFVSNMTAMMSILQFLFYALAPLSAAVMLFAGAQGVGIFTKYLVFGLWTQSWFPVAAVLNNYGQMTASEMLTKYGIAISAGGTPSATTLLSGNNLPFVIEHVSKILANVDMMMALTPVITMIVFTGSYMAMSGLAQDINGEVQSRGALGSEAPSLANQEKAFGVSAPGNAAGSYMVTDGATAGLGYSVGNTASLASTAAQSTAATATDSATQATNHAASMVYGALSQHGVDQTAAWKSSDQGARETTTAFKHAQDFAHSTGVSMDQAFAMQAAYEGALKLPGATPESAWKSVASGALASVIGGLKGAERDELKRGIQNKDVEGWKNELSSGEAAKFVQSVARENGTAISQKQADKVDQAVTDGKRAEVAAQEAVAHAAKIEQQASTMRSVGGNAKVDQNAIAGYFANPRNPLGPLTRHSAQIMASKAGGHQAVEALTQAEQELAHTGQTGPALEAAALTKIGMMNPEIGLGIASQLYGDMGPGLKGMNAVQEGAQRQINDTQGNVDTAKAKLNPALQNANHAEKTADASKASGAAKQDVPTITSTAPTTNPKDFAAAGQRSIVANHQGDVAPTKAFKDGMDAVNHAPGMDLLQNTSPYAFLGMLAGGNAVSGALQGYSKHLLEKKLQERLANADGKPKTPGGPDNPGGDAPSGAPDKPGPEGNPPKGSPDTPDPAGKGAAPGAPEGGKGPASAAPDSPPTDYAARQQAARDALNPVQRAEPAITDASELAEKRLAARAGADAALSVADQTALQEAKTAILRAGEKFAAKTAAGTTIAAGAGATGIGAPIAGAIEVANVVMNVDAAVDVAKALYTYAKTPGASEEVVSALQSTANSIMEQVGKPLETSVPNVMP